MACSCGQDCWCVGGCITLRVCQSGPMVRLSPSAVMDGGYVVSACVFRPQGRSVTTRYSAVTTANDLGPGGDVFDGEAVTLLTSEMRGIGAGHLRRSGRWRTAA
jgi:hypothetical protein